MPTLHKPSKTGYCLPSYSLPSSCSHQMFHRVGVKEGKECQPTYVYPEEVKMLLRSVFSQNICDYPDPCHDSVSMSHFYYSFAHYNCTLRISSWVRMCNRLWFVSGGVCHCWRSAQTWNQLKIGFLFISFFPVSCTCNWWASYMWQDYF